MNQADEEEKSVGAADFTKYLLPTLSAKSSQQLSNNSNSDSAPQLNPQQYAHQSNDLDANFDNSMPPLRFRGQICPGLNKKDDDHFANTSPAYR